MGMAGRPLKLEVVEANNNIEIASKIIGNDLSEDEQRKLAEKYLAEVSAPDEQ